MAQHPSTPNLRLTADLTYRGHPSAQRRFYGLMVASTAAGLGLGSAVTTVRPPSPAR